MDRDSLRIVREGYDRMAADYTAWRDQGPPLFEDELRDLAARLPPEAAVLDVGCGAGVPFALWLSERFNVTGVDFSAGQLALARRRVPRARFLHQDMTSLDVPPHSFDAVTCFYALIHVPRDRHAKVLAGFRRAIKPDGLLMLITGNGDNPDDRDEFFGVPMRWSHFDRPTSLRMVRQAGFAVLWDKVVSDCPPASHTLLLAMAI